MRVTPSRLAVLACLLAATRAPLQLPAQSPYAPPPPGGPYGTQVPPHTAVLGRQLSTAPAAYTQGYNPLMNPAPSSPSVLPPEAYAGAQPFSLATSGMAPGGYGGYYGHPAYYGRAGGALAGYGQAMQGFSTTVQATGQYEKDIQTARIIREQSRQAQIDTQRREVEYQLWYEGVRPTAPKMIAAERKADLDWARKNPYGSEVRSGRTLNVLLQSILGSPAPTAGPNLYLDPETLRGLNLTGEGSGSLALAKDDGKIEWTDALLEPSFDEPRDRFSKNFALAMRLTGQGEMPDRTLLNDLRADLKKLEGKLDDQVANLSPSSYIQSRRVINKLKDALKGLSDSRTVKASASGWKRDVRTVAQLVDHCLRTGSQFGPAAASGDEPCYMTAYYALRAYERDLVQLASARSPGGR